MPTTDLQPSVSPRQDILLIIITLIYFFFSFVFRILEQLIPEAIHGGIDTITPTVFSLVIFLLGVIGLCGSIFLIERILFKSIRFKGISLESYFGKKGQFAYAIIAVTLVFLIMLINEPIFMPFSSIFLVLFLSRVLISFSFLMNTVD